MICTYAIMGTASGIGFATRAYIERQGARVNGVDLRDVKVIADLSTLSGRTAPHNNSNLLQLEKNCWEW